MKNLDIFWKKLGIFVNLCHLKVNYANSWKISSIFCKFQSGDFDLPCLRTAALACRSCVSFSLFGQTWHMFFKSAWWPFKKLITQEATGIATPYWSGFADQFIMGGISPPSMLCYGFVYFLEQFSTEIPFRQGEISFQKWCSKSFVRKFFLDWRARAFLWTSPRLLKSQNLPFFSREKMQFWVEFGKNCKDFSVFNKFWPFIALSAVPERILFWKYGCWNTNFKAKSLIFWGFLKFDHSKSRLILEENLSPPQRFEPQTLVWKGMQPKTALAAAWWPFEHTTCLRFWNLPFKNKHLSHDCLTGMCTKAQKN